MASDSRSTFLGRDSKAALIWAFGAVLLLIVVLVVLARTQMTALNSHLNSIVNEQIVKTDLISAMRNAARERSIALHRMAVMRDPFDREDEFRRFNQLASEFLTARARYQSLQPTDMEKASLARVLVMTGASARIQDQVIALIQAEDIGAANELLVGKAIPEQNNAIGELGKMLDLQRQAAQDAVKAADQAYRATQALMLLLGLVATSLGVVIAVAVIRRTDRIESALATEKMRAEVTLHSIGEAVITTDVDGCVEHLNKVAQELTGWGEQEAQGVPLREVFCVVSAAPVEETAFPSVGMAGTSCTAATEPYAQLLARDGREFTIEESVAPICDPAGRVIGSVVVFRDVSESHDMSRKLSFAASHDALTGLPNRRDFEYRLAILLESARVDHKQHALLYLDLDQFKVVNDTCGHVAGDELLRQLAQVLTPKLRGSDLLARLGGDEFGVLLEGCDTENAAAIAEKMREAVVDFRFAWQGKVFEIGVSIGAVGIDANSEGAASIMSAADSACYEAKDQGRNRVHLYLPDDELLSQRRGEMDWVQRITQALEKNQFRLYRQAIAPTARDTGEVGHYEILLRLQREDGTIVPPMAFIPAAERYNLMSAIDRWVIRNVLEFLGRQSAGTQAVYSINLSGQSLGDPNLQAFITESIERSGVAPEGICFEITETAAIANLGKAAKFIGALRSMGCRFSLDDFGSGMSSLAYLKNLPVDYLKIDGAFVRDIVDDPIDFAMVGAINSIAQVMKIKTIAEFVENQAILDKLISIGVNYGQGYHIHKPEPLP